MWTSQVLGHRDARAIVDTIAREVIGERSRSEGFPMTNFGDLRYTGWGGGVPIRLKGEVVGAVGVSGLPENEDIELAQIGAATIDGGQP